MITVDWGRQPVINGKEITVFFTNGATATGQMLVDYRQGAIVFFPGSCTIVRFNWMWCQFDVVAKGVTIEEFV